MRLALCFFLASALAARGQDVFSTPAPTPFPPYRVVTGPTVAKLPSTQAGPKAAAFTLSPAVTPAQFSTFINAASTSELNQLILGAVADPSQIVLLLSGSDLPARQRLLGIIAGSPPAVAKAYLVALIAHKTLSVALEGVEPETAKGLLLSASGSPEVSAAIMQTMAAGHTLAAVVSKATSAELLTMLGSVAQSAEAADLLLDAIASAGSFHSLAVALAAKAEPSGIDLKPIDMDILIAVSNFTGQDARFKDIAPLSYYGKKLAVLKRKVKAEGMTPENKTTMVALYKEAADALQQFKSVEQKQ